MSLQNDFDFSKITNAKANEDGIFETPVLVVKEQVVFPKIIMPLMSEGDIALEICTNAIKSHQTIVVVAVPVEDLSGLDSVIMGKVGTEVAITQIVPMSAGVFSVLVEGRRRIIINDTLSHIPLPIVKARLLNDTIADVDNATALKQTLFEMFEEVVELIGNISEEVVSYATEINDASWLTDFAITIINASYQNRQKALEMTILEERMRFVINLLSHELRVLNIKEEIEGQVQQEMTRNQRESYLREQMRIIQGELGDEDFFQQEFEELRRQILAAQLPPNIHEKAMKEYNRLQIIPPMAPEVGMIRTYIEWLIELPWRKASTDNLDLKRAQAILEAEHYGLPKVKDRILEHIAVRKLAADKMKTPILCFVGPPGVGKTSLGKSIATALGREFVRVSLGGVHDEAEIRGHRRTYIGALPGRIIQTMRRAGTVNPVFMLDEIDKLGADYRGDPGSALLEVLDPEQNKGFSDHYLDIDYDLSQVLFITTANDLEPLEPALLDRLEIVEFPGYTEEDKLAIAKQFLIPKQLEGHGLLEAGLSFSMVALQNIIREYTYEAGVRNLSREIGTMCRKTARLIAEERPYPRRLTANHVATYLGPPHHIESRANDTDSIGIVTGLAWTPYGGDVLNIEVAIFPGKGTLSMTGQLGDVMQESAQAALSYLRANARIWEIPSDDFESYDVHLHIPEGATPKDGPSAGVSLATAIISAFTECPVRADFAMTGEITLRGRILPVGGIKEKLLAAHRSRIFKIILPEQNRKDLADIPDKALREMKIHFVNNIAQVLELVLLPPPVDGRERDKYREEAEDAEKVTDK
ncbi:MAG: endopeptidase La [Phototrophicales bacterium]|nr:endopeptidase La [Phototrophicales bacterium]